MAFSKIIGSVLALGSTVVISAPAGATIATAYFQGVTTQSTILGSAATFSGSFSYETTTTANFTNTNLAEFHPFTSFSFSSGTTSTVGSAVDPGWNAASTLDGNDLVVHDNPGNIDDDAIIFIDDYTYSLDFPTAFLLSNYYYSFTFGFQGNSSQVFQGTDLPLTWDINSFSHVDLWVYRLDPANLYEGEGTILRGYLTGLSMEPMLVEGTSDVPEPKAWAIMTFGFGIIGGGLRHRRLRAQATT